MLSALTFGFLHSLECFVLDLLKLILTETILVIKRACARAHLPKLWKIFLLHLFDPTLDEKRNFRPKGDGRSGP